MTSAAGQMERHVPLPVSDLDYVPTLVYQQSHHSAVEGGEVMEGGREGGS